ncbi:MAG: tetratricopeptide repeat protein, partial [Pseudobdellovibrio sp.]
ATKGDYLSQKFNFVEASKTLTEGLKRGGPSYDIVKTQALVEFRKNNMVTTITYGEKAMKMYDADVELLCLLANANIGLYLNAPSRSKEEEQRKQKYIEDAQKYASKAVDLEPSWPDAQITYSKYLFARNGSLAAENNFKKVIETFPYTVEYRLGLAEFYELQEKYKSASEIYNQILEGDPKNKKALMGFARSNQFMNNMNAAKKFYMKAAVLDPSDVEPLFATAQLELETATQRDLSVTVSSAYKKFRMVREINPNYPRISYFIARCHFALGEFDKAIEMINEEKKKNPGIADPYLLAAEVYNEKEQYKECAAEYSLGIKLRPTSADLYVKAASCYRKSEAVDIAQDMLEIAKQKENGYAPIYREEGFIYESLGQMRDAKQRFQLYLELSPNAPDRQAIESKISALGG